MQLTIEAWRSLDVPVHGSTRESHMVNRRRSHEPLALLVRMWRTSILWGQNLERKGARAIERADEHPDRV